MKIEHPAYVFGKKTARDVELVYHSSKTTPRGMEAVFTLSKQHLLNVLQERLEAHSLRHALPGNLKIEKVTNTPIFEVHVQATGNAVAHLKEMIEGVKAAKQAHRA
ncbi:MAG TPA: hypothetical protein VGQ00_01270 [Candidatus Norongarragalinales archaeon]|jgi:hypothetical protein|nr:hypothetical protein [Candidatus Norongarragalinales archaeon]